MICASSIGFSDLDRAQCAQSAVGEDGGPRKEAIGLESFVANALAGNGFAARVLGVAYTNGVALPLVRLNLDPCDAFASSSGSGCTDPASAPGVASFGAGSLNDVLTDEQEALLGCGRFFGTDCESDGIDLQNAEASVLIQSWPGFGAPIVPGSRGPSDPGYDPAVDGCTAPDASPQCVLAHPLVTPTNTFQTEMAALSWNFLMTLVAFSQPPTGEPPAIDEFDPADPMSTAEHQCSFAQPQYCSSVAAYFELPEPGAALASAAALFTLSLLGARPRRS